MTPRSNIRNKMMGDTMYRSIRRTDRGTALPLFALAWALPGLALGAAPDESAGTLEEVVVTALKRGNETVQSVPVSIAVLDSTRLEKMGAAEFADFARSVSGLTFVDAGAANKRYVIRGINSAGEAQSALYYDNIPVTGLGGAATEFGGTQPDLALYDVQQIEVLRGPQGTLYGSNSRSEEHTSELQSLRHLVCRLLLEKKKKKIEIAREKME